jgi:hypothetical protein
MYRRYESHASLEGLTIANALHLQLDLVPMMGRGGREQGANATDAEKLTRLLSGEVVAKAMNPRGFAGSRQGLLGSGSGICASEGTNSQDSTTPRIRA